jgi:hypothetical protein
VPKDLSARLEDLLSMPERSIRAVLGLAAHLRLTVVQLVMLLRDLLWQCGRLQGSLPQHLKRRGQRVWGRCWRGELWVLVDGGQMSFGPLRVGQ